MYIFTTSFYRFAWRDGTNIRILFINMYTQLYLSSPSLFIIQLFHINSYFLYQFLTCKIMNTYFLSPFFLILFFCSISVLLKSQNQLNTINSIVKNLASILFLCFIFFRFSKIKISLKISIDYPIDRNIHTNPFSPLQNKEDKEKQKTCKFKPRCAWADEWMRNANQSNINAIRKRFKRSRAGTKIG